MSWIKLFLGGTWAYLIAAGGAILAAFGYIQKVKYDTRKAEREKAEQVKSKYEKEQLKKRVEHDEEIDTLDDIDLDRRLREQSRRH